MQSSFKSPCRRRRNAPNFHDVQRRLLATREQQEDSWNRIISALRQDQDAKRRKELFWCLLDVAREDARRVLRGVWQLSDDEKDILVLEVLAPSKSNLPHGKTFLAIVNAKSPRGFFSNTLYWRALDLVKRGDVRGTKPLNERLHAPTDDEFEDRNIAKVDAREALSRLSPRDREVIVAGLLGKDRNEMARAHSMKRPAVDQAYSRGLKRIQGGL